MKTTGSFHDCFDKCHRRKKYGEQLKLMNVYNKQGKIAEEQKELIGIEIWLVQYLLLPALYTTFVFQKTEKT